MIIFKDFTFDSAHFLPNVPEDHKCRRMHGHTYRLRLYVKGELDPTLGWVMDFADIKAAWKTIEDRLDHHCLNDIPGLENPTAEHIAAWIWEKLRPQLPLLHKLELWESPTAGVVFEG
ncbi:MAG: 6-carboxytetrahydropterin synthase QueD [Phaeodactylibacter sp.]|nr:6-carboxytetrahydropterin synthase QueD [Phaeodactylibacter sp.]MCB9051782.1 6-carboxytetrahydropterin synthase QueD [Lewinellaceae bacterium]